MAAWRKRLIRYLHGTSNKDTHIAAIPAHTPVIYDYSLAKMELALFLAQWCPNEIIENQPQWHVEEYENIITISAQIKWKSAFEYRHYQSVIDREIGVKRYIDGILWQECLYE